MARAEAHDSDTHQSPQQSQNISSHGEGLEFPRVFSRAGTDPFDECEWEVRSAVIGSERGEVVFEQRDVEIPKSWSQTATNIVVSKYFRGQLGSAERETSVRQLIGRVVDTITNILLAVMTSVHLVTT